MKPSGPDSTSERAMIWRALHPARLSKVPMLQRLSVAFLAAAHLVACDGGDPADGGIPLEDAGPPLEPSELFGPCVEDWQCPGEGAICRTAADGYPSGFCTVPCEDRTPCDARGVYHHCLLREGEEQSYCERRCLNGIDCGRDAYSCTGELPPSGGLCIAVCSTDAQCGDGFACNTYTGQCVEGDVPTTGAVTGEACGSPDDCRSGQCVTEVNDAGVPTGWVGGYCAGNCILPSGFNNNDFFAGDALPQGTCPGDAVCLPAGDGQARGDLGRCYDQCAADGDCRPGYTCLTEIGLASGAVSVYTNGLCVPDDCGAAGCPSGYTCVSVTGSDGRPRNVCAPS